MSKWRAKFTCFQKALNYERDYLLRKFKPFQFLLFVILLFGAVITGLSDTSSFFLDITDFIPQKWDFLKDKRIVLILSAIIIITLYILAWINDLSQASKQANELSSITRDYLIPLQQTELKRFKTAIRKNFNLSDSVRLSIFVPVRIGCLQWRLQMVCRTENILDRELKALFKLNEGVLGYSLLKSQKHCMEFIDVSNINNLPATYLPLSQENSILINRNLKGVLVAAAFQEGSIAGLLAIDTDKLADLGEMQQYELHSAALDWIIAKSDVIRLLWRMKNNV